MKKLFVVLLALAVIGVFAFAQDAPAMAAPVVSIGDWGRQVFTVGNQDSSGYWAGLSASWGANPRIVGLNIQAHNDNAGFSITPSADNGVFGLTDQNKAWVSPLPGVTFEAGLNLETDTWRGSSDFGSDDWLRMPGVAVGGNSSTFARLGEGGFMTALEYNKDGIGAWAAVQNAGSGTNSVATTDISTALQAGAAYTVAGIATIKAQYLGSAVAGTGMMGNPGKVNTINGAINVSAVKGLYEEAGILYPLTDVGYTMAIADDLSYAMAPLTVHARVEYIGYDSKNAAGSDMGLSGAVGVDYDLGNGVGVSADVQYVNAAQESNANYVAASAAVPATPYAFAVKAVPAVLTTPALTGFGAYIKKAFSNGFVGIGFEYSTIGWAGGDAVGVSNASGHWAIPIVFSEWF